MDHWILLRRNLPVLALEQLPPAGRAGTISGRFRAVLLALPGRVGHAGRLRALCRLARERYAHTSERRCPKTNAACAKTVIAQATGDRARLSRQRPAAARAQPADVWHAVARRRACAWTPIRSSPRSCAQRFRYILVDEFQDTNVAQIELLWRLAGGHRNIVAVGDNAQAIYRFRGASFGSFTIFLERFAGRSARRSRRSRARFIQPLVDNYRSTGAHPARGRRKSRAFWNSLRWCLRKSWCAQARRRKSAHRGIRLGRRTRRAGSRRRSSGCIAPASPGGTFAALYRIHRHRDRLVEALEERGIPFRHSQSFDPESSAGARFARLPAAAREAVGQRRLRARAGGSGVGARTGRSGAALRARRKAKSSLWDALQSAQGELPFAASKGGRTDELVAGTHGLARSARAARRGHRTFRRAERMAGAFAGDAARRPAAIVDRLRAIRARVAAQERDFAAGGIRRSISTISRKPADRSTSNKKAATPCN